MKVVRRGRDLFKNFLFLLAAAAASVLAVTEERHRNSMCKPVSGIYRNDTFCELAVPDIGVEGEESFHGGSAASKTSFGRGVGFYERIRRHDPESGRGVGAVGGGSSPHSRFLHSDHDLRSSSARHYILDLQWQTLALDLVPGEVSCVMRTRTFNGTIPGPVVGIRSGETLRLTYRNLLTNNTYTALPGQEDTTTSDAWIDQIPADSEFLSLQTPEEQQAYLDRTRNTYRVPDVSNVHTHGLWVSGRRPADDVDIFVPPGFQYTYEYHLPLEHMPGLAWLHPHFHGSSSLQVGGGALSPLLVLPRKNAALTNSLTNSGAQQATGEEMKQPEESEPAFGEPGGPALVPGTPSDADVVVRGVEGGHDHVEKFIPVGGDLSSPVIFDGKVERDLIFSIQTWDLAAKWGKVLKATKDADWQFVCRSSRADRRVRDVVGDEATATTPTVNTEKNTEGLSQIDIPRELVAKHGAKLTKFALVNGVVAPSLTISRNKWQRWRFLYTSSASPVFNIKIDKIRQHGAVPGEQGDKNCEVFLLAKDTVFINDFPRELRDGLIPLPSGGRAEVFVRCQTDFVVLGENPDSVVAQVKVVLDQEAARVAKNVPIAEISPWLSYDSVLNPAYVRDLRDGGAFFLDRPDEGMKEGAVLKTKMAGSLHQCLAQPPGYLEQIIQESGAQGQGLGVPEKVRYGQIRFTDDCGNYTAPGVEESGDEVQDTILPLGEEVQDRLDGTEGEDDNMLGLSPETGFGYELEEETDKFGREVGSSGTGDRMLLWTSPERSFVHDLEAGASFNTLVENAPTRKKTDTKKFSNCINYRKYEPSFVLQYPRLGEVQERWVLGLHKHPFHQHIFPFQILGGFDESDYFRVGDWHDSWFLKNQEPNRFAVLRWRPERFGNQRVVIHCHLLNHQDEGMMAQDWVLGGQQPPYEKGKHTQTLISTLNRLPPVEHGEEMCEGQYPDQRLVEVSTRSSFAQTNHSGHFFFVVVAIDVLVMMSFTIWNGAEFGTERPHDHYD